MKKILERMRMERLYQEDYTRTMEKEHKRLEEERLAKEQAQKEQAEREQREFEEFMADYERDSAKFNF